MDSAGSDMAGLTSDHRQRSGVGGALPQLRSTPSAYLLPGLGLLIPMPLVSLWGFGNLREHLVLFLWCFGLAFGLFLVAAWLVLRYPALAVGRRLGLLLGIALLARLSLLPMAPTLSDDLYRYVWEGGVLTAGLSPYQYAPDAPQLVSLRDEAIWPRVNNPSVQSPYPPLAQIGGLIGSWLTPGSPLGVKFVAMLADLLVVAGLLWLLQVTGQPAGRALLYAWHPLVLIEFAHSGHNDALMVAPLVMALALVAAGARWRPALLMALAALAKIGPLLLVPLLVGRLGWRPVVLLLGLVGLGWLPFLWLGGGAIGSLLLYLGNWSDNDSLHALLRLVVGAAGAKAICLIVLLIGLALVARHPGLRQRPLWWQTYVVFGLSFSLASSVHAWYLTWLLPLLAVNLEALDDWPFFQPWPALGWLLFSGLVALPYLTYDTHQWQLWISLVEYLPLYLLLLISWWPRQRPGRSRMA